MTGKKTDGEMAVVYARFSSAKQHETSIEGQLAAAQKYAEKKGYTIIREYCDRAKTGTNDNREAFQQMLHDCAKKQFSVIIVWKVDRFGRNREEITFNKYKAKKNGVRVEYVAENVVEGPEGVILESVLEGMAEYYSLQLSQNVRRGLLEAAKKHHVPGGRAIAFGYKAAADKTYEIDPVTGPIAKKIFEMYAAGSTEFEIIRYLNEQGHRTKRGVAFNRSSLKKMLHNELYIGTYIYKDIIRDEGAVPALIDKDTFRKVQDMLKINKRMPSHKWSYSDYLLTGKLFCGKCGSSMIGKSGTSRTGDKHCYYGCWNRHNGKGCDKQNVRQDYIEPLVLAKIHEILHDPEIFQLIVDKTWEFYLKQDTEQTEIQAMQTELESVEKGISNLVKSVESGMPFELIQTRLDELNGQKAALKKALADRELAKGIKLTKDRIQFFLETMRDMDTDNLEAKKRLIDTFVNAIFLYDDHFLITLNFSGDGNTVKVEDIEKATTDGTSEVFDCSRSPVPERPTEEPLRLIWYMHLDVFAIEGLL